MIQDVSDSVKNDKRKRNSVTAQLCPRTSRSSNEPFLSKIRNFNHLALNPIGSFFSAQPLPNSSTQTGDAKYADHLRAASELKEEQSNFHDCSGFRRENYDTGLLPLAAEYQELHTEDYCSVKPLPQPKYGESSGLMSVFELTDSNHSEAHISTHLPEFRCLVGHLSRSRREFGYLAHDDSGNVKSALNGPTSSDSDYKSSAMSTSLASNATSFSSSSCNCSSSVYSHGQWTTPPGPDSSAAETLPRKTGSSNAQTLPPIRLSLECSGHSSSAYNLNASGNSEDILADIADPRQKMDEDSHEEHLYASSNLWEVKEGKKPERLSVRSVFFVECCFSVAFN